MRSLPLWRSSLLSLATTRNGHDIVDKGTLSNVVPPRAKGHRRLVLVRHGETDWNARGLMQGGAFDIELNHDGQRQADCARAHLICQDLGLVASSHLRRASSTADTIQQEHPKAARIINQDLGEMRFGDFEGTMIQGPETCPEHRSKFLAISEAMKSDKKLAWPGKDGESILDVEMRSRLAIDLLLQDFPVLTMCVVAHGRTNKILLASLLGVEESNLPLQSNACINVLDMDANGTWKAQLINYTGHLVDEPLSL